MKGRVDGSGRKAPKGTLMQARRYGTLGFWVRAIVTMTVAGNAAAQQFTRNQGYLVDQNFSAVTSSATRLCWRTSDWSPSLAAKAEACKQCDADLCPPPPAASAPKPTPKPETKPRAEPGKVPLQKINFSADALFDFDKADLRADGKTRLDDLARVLQGMKYEVILAIGHTDPIGSTEYNLKLSIRRAEAVKRYLIGRGIEPGRVRAEGKGKTHLLIKPADCKGKTGKALIACYQPNRRVDVEVAGTR